MSTWTIVLALLGSMMMGVLLTILVDTFYVRRFYEAVQSDKEQVADKLRQRTVQLGRVEANYAELSKKIRAYQRELDEEQAETTRLDDLRVTLETKLETAVADTDALKAFTNYEEVKAETIRRSAMNRMGSPDDIAGAVYFLCTEEASWITGQTIVVDGGTTFR